MAIVSFYYFTFEKFIRALRLMYSVLYCYRERRPEEKPSLEKGTCSKRDLHVNMSQLLGDAFVYPPTFNVYTCAGKCESPSQGNRLDLFTNHAIVQYRMQTDLSLTNWNSNVDFCCVPYKYESVNILKYSDKTKKHVVSCRHAELIVTECKCIT